MADLTPPLTPSSNGKIPVSNPPPGSPLNPTSSLAIPVLRRPSTRGFMGHRKSLTPHNTPDRFTPRTPLTFLSNSPTASSTGGMPSSYASSVGWQLQTPPSTPGPPIFESSSPYMATPRKSSGSTSSLGYQMHIEIPSSSRSSDASIGSTPRSTLDDMAYAGPSPLDKMDHLFSIPPSPPIMMPSAQLLEMPPNYHPDPHNQHSIASPFVNIKSSPSPLAAKPGPVSCISPLVNTHPRRHGIKLRRGSNLAHEMNALDLDDAADNVDAKYGLDADTIDGQCALVPSPTRSNHDVTRTA